MINTNPYRVMPGEAIDLAQRPTRDRGGLKPEQGRADYLDLRRKLVKLQELLYADGSKAVLVVMQAMDAGGKDSTIRRVFGPINPQGCKVTSFKVPNSAERQQDYLWRIHRAAPAKGHIGVFNRSHYEDVLVVRVKGLAPESVWRRRYDHINHFEQLLHDEGTRVVKFYLHISKDYQKRRLQRRLDNPDKHWKFTPSDLEERTRWDDYQQAFAEALSRCSTEHAPWYIVPAERRWFRDVLVAQVMVETLQSMNLQYPKIDFDPSKVRIE